MAVEIKVPSVGESITRGHHLRAGSSRTATASRPNEPVCRAGDRQGDHRKCAAPPPACCTSRSPEGQTVAIGAVDRQRRSTGEPPPPAADPRRRARPARRRTQAAQGRPPPQPAPAERCRLSPAARRLARRRASTPARSPPLGPRRPRHQGGRARTSGAAAGPPPPPEHRPPHREAPSAACPVAAAATGRGRARRETRQRMTPIRQRIAERLLAAQQNAAILTTFNEADLSRRHGPAGQVQGDASRRSTASAWASCASSSRRASRR